MIFQSFCPITSKSMSKSCFVDHLGVFGKNGQVFRVYDDMIKEKVISTHKIKKWFIK
jgi:hypothetical protein